MDILFASNKLQKECTEMRKIQKKHGAQRAKLIGLRLDQMADAENLEILKLLPGARSHALSADRNGQWAVNLDHPYRLIFEPANEPIPLNIGGGLELSQINSVRILEIVDYHG